MVASLLVWNYNVMHVQCNEQHQQIGQLCFICIHPSSLIPYPNPPPPTPPKKNIYIYIHIYVYMAYILTIK